MTLTALDLIIIAAYLALSLGIGLYYTRRASGSLEGYFLAGRSFPWWLSGISLVATTFAADTPLAITELVAKDGIAGNWLWWNMLAGGMLTTLFFARLWWRSGILTDVELVEFRYGGVAARWLRGYKAIYFGLLLNMIIIGWVNQAMISILEVFFDLDPQTAFWLTGGVMALTVVYSGLSGLMGVAVADAFQFTLAMAGCIALAVIVVTSEKIGGLSGLASSLPAERLSFFPTLGDSPSGVSDLGATPTRLALSFGAFLAFVGVQWWSSWYPGAEPGGGGYVAQRLMSTRTGREATLSALLFQMLHFCLRPWPWILVALCALVLYPGLAQPKFGYVLAMRDYLPGGLRGLMLAAFLAAYMSTISTQFNWGAGYLVNDVYLRFIRPGASQRGQIRASRLATALLALCGLATTPLLTSIAGAWQFILQAGAGLGLVLILRWYWWRINAWSELTASVVPLVLYGGLVVAGPWLAEAGGVWAWMGTFPGSFFVTVGLTTAAWLIATLATAPEPDAILDRFYERVRPEAGWAPVRRRLGLEATPGHVMPLRLLAWAAATLMGYSVLFGVGYALLGPGWLAGVWALVAGLAGGVFYWAGQRSQAW